MHLRAFVGSNDNKSTYRRQINFPYRNSDKESLRCKVVLWHHDFCGPCSEQNNCRIISRKVTLNKCRKCRSVRLSNHLRNSNFVAQKPAYYIVAPVYAAYIAIITDTGNMRTIPGYKEVCWRFRSAGLTKNRNEGKSSKSFPASVASRQNDLPTMVAGRETVNPAISLFLLRMMTLVSCAHKNEIIPITMRDHSFYLFFLFFRQALTKLL